MNIGIAFQGSREEKQDVSVLESRKKGRRLLKCKSDLHFPSSSHTTDPAVDEAFFGFVSILQQATCQHLYTRFDCRHAFEISSSRCCLVAVFFTSQGSHLTQWRCKWGLCSRGEFVPMLLIDGRP